MNSIRFSFFDFASEAVKRSFFTIYSSRDTKRSEREERTYISTKEYTSVMFMLQHDSI